VIGPLGRSTWHLRFRSIIDVYGNAVRIVIVLEHGHQFEASPQAGKVLAQSRQLQITCMFKLGHRGLTHPELGCEIHL
jgi:hypothetical protein